jgi:hypothetical protein
MINHFRTLLANLPLVGIQPLPDGEEFIPSGFAPLEIPTELFKLYRVFIPTTASRALVNQLAFSYMQEAHAPDFEAFVTKLDSRITYELREEFFLRKMSLGEITQSASFTTKFSQVATAAVQVISADALFKSFYPYEAEMAELRLIYGGSPTQAAKLTAILIALVYQLECARLVRGG